MKLYHGSKTVNLEILKPFLADHGRPYVYMSTIDVVAAKEVKILWVKLFYLLL